MVASDVATIEKGVAVLCVDGPLEHKSASEWWSYWQTYEDLARDFKLVLDDASVRAVVLKFDSPGGECAGLNETVAIMRAMKAKSGKPVIAYVDEACYSAAYALAMVCDEIYLPESGGVGSIGVITALCDVTKMNEKQGLRVEVIASGTKKTDGHPAVAISEGAIKRTRRAVDKLAASFFDLVAGARGLSVEAVAGYQAGTFMGEDAVSAGLADGVMSLHDCLTFTRNEFSSSSNPPERSEDKDQEAMPGKIANAKAVSDANKALVAANAAMTAAKTDAERALAAARVLAAEEIVAKVKKTKTVTTDTHEELIDDGEEEEAETAAEDDAPPSDDEDEDEDEDEDADAKASRDAARVLAVARKLTGKKSIEGVIGALTALGANTRRHGALAKEVAELRADSRQTKIAALVTSGMKSGKLAPAQRAWARTQSPEALRAYLDATPPMVHTTDAEHTEARIEGGAQPGAVTAEMAKIWRKLGHAEKDFPALLAKMNGNKPTLNGAS